RCMYMYLFSFYKTETRQTAVRHHFIRLAPSTSSNMLHETLTTPPTARSRKKSVLDDK
ncbi:hypothetical protein BaRGS_00022622, partial [Batillaria attramentaria]